MEGKSMKHESKINTFQCTNGARVSKGVINRNIRKAKEIKVREFKNDNGFIRCEFTDQSSGTYIDIMHIISVDECQKTGQTELSWCQSNLRFGTRAIHNNHDKKTNQEREIIYKQLNTN